jgi:predicted nucleotidyltransferase
MARENLALREQIEAYEEDLRSLMERLRRTTP